MKQNKSEALGTFTAKQIAAIPLLLDGKTGVEVAKAIKVQPSTVSKWLNHDSDFSLHLQNIRSERMQAANSILDSSTLQAAYELKRLMSSAKSESVRIRACEIFLDRINGMAGTPVEKTSVSTVNLPLLLRALGIQ